MGRAAASAVRAQALPATLLIAGGARGAAQAPLQALYRCTDGAADHFVSTDAGCEGATRDAALGCGVTSALSGAHPIWRCLSGADHFTSTQSDCEGLKVDGPLGYLLGDARPGCRALYRCYTGADHFASTEPGCGGATREELLGYVVDDAGGACPAAIPPAGPVSPTPSPPPSPPTPAPAPPPPPSPAGSCPAGPPSGGAVTAATTLSNAAIGITIDGTKGCAIAAAWATGDAAKTNLINTADLGRYVQVSFYAGPDGYDGCSYRGNAWPWNPIGAGDVHGHPSVLIDSRVSATEARCTVRPMQWACDNVQCDCTYDIVYSLDDDVVNTCVTLHNKRTDHTDYGARDQELPAVYVNGPLYRLLGYTGSSPCTGGTLTEWDAGFDNSKAFPWVPGHVSPTEPWLAFVQQNSFGVGVYNAHADGFLGGFSGAKGSGGTKDGATGYIAPVSTVDLPWDIEYSYKFALIIGDIDTIRSKACALRVRDGPRPNATSAPPAQPPRSGRSAGGEHVIPSNRRIASRYAAE